MRVRALAYSLFLCALLAYLSFRIHSAPSQVERRLERDLGEYLRVEPRVDDGEQPSIGLITARAILIPAGPPLDERTILGLEDVRINDPRSARAFRRVLESESAGAATSSFSLHASRASLRLDHSVEDSAGKESHRWNFDELLQTDALDLLGRRRAQVLLDRVEMRVQELRAGRPRLGYSFGLRDAEVRTGPDGVIMDADILEGDSWSAGRVVARWAPGGSLELGGGLEDFHSLEPWLPLVPEAHRLLLELLQPSGAVAVDIDELRVGRTGVEALRASVRHYDTQVRLGELGIGLTRIHGAMVLTRDGVSLGRDAPGASAELLGIPVDVSAEVDASRARVHLSATRFSLEALALESGAAGAASRPLQTLWASLRPYGHLTGKADIELAPRERERLEGEVLLEDVSLAGVPAVAGGSASIQLESEAGPGRKAAGKGRIRLGSIPVHGLGKLRGEAQIAWEGPEVRFTLFDARWEPPSAPDGAAAGSLFGSIAWSLDSGLGDVELRWTGGAISTGVLESSGVAGQWKKAGGTNAGNLELAGSRIPAGALGSGSEELLFETGDAILQIVESKLRVVSLRLIGERHTLRATGTMSPAGGLDLVVVVAGGMTRTALGGLPHVSGPAEWLEAARGSFRAFRITGTPFAPAAREIGELDPAFVRE